MAGTADITGVVQNPGIGEILGGGFSNLAQFLAQKQQLAQQQAFQQQQLAQGQQRINLQASDQSFQQSQAAAQLARDQAARLNVGNALTGLMGTSGGAGAGLPPSMSPPAGGAPAVPAGAPQAGVPSVGTQAMGAPAAVSGAPPQMTVAQVLASVDPQYRQQFVDTAKPIIDVRLKAEQAQADRQQKEAMARALVESVPASMRGPMSAMMQAGIMGLPQEVQTLIYRQAAATNPQGLVDFDATYPQFKNLTPETKVQLLAQMMESKFQALNKFGAAYDTQQKLQIDRARLGLDAARLAFEGVSRDGKRQAALDVIGRANEYLRTQAQDPQNMAESMKPADVRLTKAFGAPFARAYHQAIQYLATNANTMLPPGAPDSVKPPPVFGDSGYSPTAGTRLVPKKLPTIPGLTPNRP